MGGQASKSQCNSHARGLMSYRSTFVVLVSVILAGCQTATVPNNRTYVPTPARSETVVRRGVQSLTRVCVSTKDSPDDLRAELMQELHRQIPQLDTMGPGDGWTLEFEFGETSVPAYPGLSAGRGDGGQLTVSVSQCRSRIVRKTVVDGREATAMAYEGPWVVGSDSGLSRGRQVLGKSDESTLEFLRRAVARFAEAWRAANVER